MSRTEQQVDRETARLLWRACRASPDVAGAVAAIDGGADVPRAAAMAVIGRTGPLLWRTLERAGALEALGEARQLLEREHDLRRVQGAVLLPLAVAAAVEPLTAAGLEPVIHKGPVVAARYPEPGLRPMDDLDVILPPEQHDAGLAALHAGGWRLVERPGHHHDTVLVHRSVPDLALELHRGLGAWRDRTQRLTATDLWRARVPVDCFGTAAFTIPPELELVALAVHAGKPFHTFQRLIWSVDFAVVIEAAGSAFDWDAVARHTERARCPTVVAMALQHARRLGVDVPHELLDIDVGRYRQAALRPVLEETWPLTVPELGERHRLRYAPWDERWRWLVLFVGEVTANGVRNIPSTLAEDVARGVRRLWRWRNEPAAAGLGLDEPRAA